MEFFPATNLFMASDSFLSKKRFFNYILNTLINKIPSSMSHDRKMMMVDYYKALLRL